MTLLQDVRYAVRLLVKDKWFTLVAILALALGLGANSAIFTFYNAVLIRNLPFDDPDRIVVLTVTDGRGRQVGVSRLDFGDIRDGARSFAGLALYVGTTMTISDEGRPAEQAQGSYASANLLPLIGQRPRIGRDFQPADDLQGAEPVVVISDGLWKNRYGADPGILGRVIRVNSTACTVIGVMPPDMKFPNNNDVWLPLSTLPPELRDSKRGVHNFSAFGRLTPGATLEQARSEVQTISTRLSQEYPDTNKDIKTSVTTFNDATPRQIKLIFTALMGAVVFVLLIACANVANLLLARSAHRSREIAVRVSLGASRWRIIRQLLVESLLLSTAAGILGFVLSLYAVRAFDAVTVDVGKPYWITFTMDGTVIAFLVVVCVATSVLFGLAPALHVSKTDVNEVMKESGGRSGTGGIRARRWTSALIVVEIVLTLVLLAGAGFMLRSFAALYRSELGFDTSQLLTMQMYLPLTKYPKPEPRIALFERIEERLRGLKAIQAATLTSNAPLFGGFLRQLEITGRPLAPGERVPEVTMVSVGNNYFDTLGARVVRGRNFNAADGTPGHESVIINQRLVAMHFGNDDPIGRTIRLVDGQPGLQPSAPVTATIVGVVPTVRQRSNQDPDPDPVAYLPYRADPQRFIFLIVRAQGEAGAITALVREEMRAIEPDLPLFRIQTMDRLLAQTRWVYRTFGTMFAIFAGIALVLSAVGLYAVTAYSVTQRTSEIGVRMALGAQPPQVMWLVLRRSLIQLAIGLPIGVAGAFGVGRLLQTILATSGRDPLTIGGIIALMIGVSIAACVWPARRATRLDPLKALRYE
jgi:putative ABC transport system permease protein